MKSFSRFVSRIISADTRRIMSTTSLTSSKAANRIDVSLKNVVEIIPELSYDTHKGQAGRIATIGGSREYTGAPYFAAMTALRLGADLSHVFCAEAASIPIKTYSPDLIVHPMLDDEDAVEQMKYWMPRLHALVIGPGLGRDEKVLLNVKGIIEVLREQQKPVVIDGDGLFLITREPSLIENYPLAILTPNVVEYNRLFQAVMGRAPENENRVDDATMLSRKLGGVTIVAKGLTDIITNGEVVTYCTEKGSPRRCGGQGDILAGSIGTFACWASRQPRDDSIPATVLSGFAGCSLMKHLNKMTFDECKVTEAGDAGRSMVTEDMIKNVGRSLCLLTS